MKPTVSFVVPCYKLAHLLGECVNSILTQTFQDFEILIMDDASPDNTAEVARSFADPRIQYILNNPNLGHLKNYNKGIGLAQGRYIWLISADDRLRTKSALEQYVKVMESNPGVGYAFSAGVGLEDGKETGRIAWGDNGNQDWVKKGRQFLLSLAEANSVLAPSGLVRRECYETQGAFPLDLPYAGDWYLWCLFSLRYDVAYFAEPFVNYRLHGLSMTNRLTRRHRVADNLAVRWRIKKLAKADHYGDVVDRCLSCLGTHYGYCLVAERFKLEDYSLTFEEFEESLTANAANQEEASFIRTLAYVSFADGCFRNTEISEALEYYRKALRIQFWMPKVWAKYLLGHMGGFGLFFRNAMKGFRRTATEKKTNP